MRKNRKSAARIREYCSYIKQMQDEGLDVELPSEWQEPCPVEITSGREFGFVRDLWSDSTLYAIPVRITCWSRTVVADFHIESLWDDYTIALPPSTEHLGLDAARCLPGEVLNDRLDAGLRMNPGAALEGLILAYGCLPIPKEVTAGTVSVQLTLVDTLGREAQGQINLAVQRTAETLTAVFARNAEFGAVARKIPAVEGTGSTTSSPVQEPSGELSFTDSSSI